MSKPVITIIGLGMTGTSLGLGLKRAEGNFEVVGHDKDPGAAGDATKMGAVDRTAWNLFRACDGAELVVLATPLGETEELLKLIADDLREGCLVLVMAKVMQPALDIGAKYLRQDIHFVVGHPILSGVGGALTARPDLFEEIPFCLATSTETDASALQLASDFVERMGAKPLYMDVHEHDGLIAAVEQLPQFVGAVLLQSISDSPAWVEGRRLAGRQFAQSTELGNSPERLFHDFLSNRENLISRIDQLQRTLADWRDKLAEDTLTVDEAADNGSTAEVSQTTTGADEVKTGEKTQEANHSLLTAIRSVWKTRESWEVQAILKDWEMVPQIETQSGGGFMQQMFFGNLFRSKSSGREPSSQQRE
ncbi:MAG: prephenate dehydrogenase/arogenate dehydrogenase family protein [Chloroflexota bacterium]